MAQKLRRVVATLLFALSVDLAQAGEKTLVFAPLPMEAPEVVVGQWKPLLNYLEHKLGISLRIDYSQRNDEVVEKFRAGTLDLAYLGPLPYVVLKEAFPAALPVVKLGSSQKTENKARLACAE